MDPRAKRFRTNGTCSHKALRDATANQRWFNLSADAFKTTLSGWGRVNILLWNSYGNGARWDNRGIGDVTSQNNHSNTGGKIIVSSCQLMRTRDFGRRELQELMIFFETCRARYWGYVQLSGEK